MAKQKGGLGARMQDFYFEITDGDGKKTVIGDDPNVDKTVKKPTPKKK